MASRHPCPSCLHSGPRHASPPPPLPPSAQNCFGWLEVGKEEAWGVVDLPVNIVEVLPRASSWSLSLRGTPTIRIYASVSPELPVAWGARGGEVGGLSPGCLPLSSDASFSGPLSQFVSVPETLISLLPVSTLFQGVSTCRRSIKPALLQLLGREVFPGAPWFGVGVCGLRAVFGMRPETDPR